MPSLLPPFFQGLEPVGHGTLSIQEGDEDGDAARHRGNLGVCQLPGPKGRHHLRPQALEPRSPARKNDFQSLVTFSLLLFP